jgi:hypothetical protein
MVDGLRTFVLDEGMGDPVVLLHGIPTQAYLWRDVARVVVRAHRVIPTCSVSVSPTAPLLPIFPRSGRRTTWIASWRNSGSTVSVWSHMTTERSSGPN